MTPLLLVAAGLVALAAGILVLRSFGSGYRIGRLLSATPAVPVSEAIELADGPPRYVAIAGRIDSEEDFEDDAHRPLVYRRVRLELGRGDPARPRWEPVDEHAQAVPFEIRDGLAAIGIDSAALGDGLVVVPRESVGVAGDAPERVPAGVEPATPLRLRVEQVSSVEHAIALGVPRAMTDGSIRLTAGLGRPLILTTLERPEAMRILGGGRSGRPLLAALALAAGLALVGAGLIWAVLAAGAGTALAASPSPTVAPGGDPRSSGQGPGLVGDPLFAIGLVVAIAAVSVVATLVYLRLTGGTRKP